MASYTSYIQQGVQNLNQGYDYTLEQIIAALGGLKNPTEDNYVQAEYRDVTDPQLRTIADYISQLGAQGYHYRYEDILQAMNEATEAGYDARFNALADANAEYNRNMAAQQESVADTIRNQYAQAIQSGVNRGMQSANILSSILGSSQAAAEGAQKLAQDRYQTGRDMEAQIRQDAVEALSKSNAAYETLMGNIRQLYNDEIQEKTADLEYNASIAETNANYLASLYNADTNYATGVLGNASGIYNNNQSVLSNIIAAAAAAAAQDGYSANYLEAARLAADANRYAADQSAIASKYTADKAYNLQAAQEAARKAAEAQAAAEKKAAEAQAALDNARANSNTKGTSSTLVTGGITQIPGAADYYKNLLSGTVSAPKGQGYGLNTSAGASRAITQTPRYIQY